MMVLPQRYDAVTRCWWTGPAGAGAEPFGPTVWAFGTYSAGGPSTTHRERSTVGTVMQDSFGLDDHARLALEVAQHAALANGDAHCGTEYLLYGLVATARGEIVELMELFALNTLRVDRAIERIMEERHASGVFEQGPPTLSLRARAALSTPRLDGKGPTGAFELLHGLLAEDDSGACRVLRSLGVHPDEARRLVAYGIRLGGR